MSQDKHTPGPWSIGKGRNTGIKVIIKDKNDMVIARADVIHAFNGRVLISNELSEANAELIARAPELLEENRRLREENKRLRRGIDKALLAETYDEQPVILKQALEGTDES